MTKKSKYNIDNSDKGKLRRTYDNILFDSELECNYYKFLLQQKAEGLIKEIILQPKFLLQKPYIRKDGKKILGIYYIADFKIIDNMGHEKVIDTKGMPKSDGILKRKMMEYLYPDIDFHWIAWSKCDGGWIDYDSLILARRKRKKDKEAKK